MCATVERYIVMVSPHKTSELKRSLFLNCYLYSFYLVKLVNNQTFLKQSPTVLMNFVYDGKCQSMSASNKQRNHTANTQLLRCQFHFSSHRTQSEILHLKCNQLMKTEETNTYLWVRVKHFVQLCYKFLYNPKILGQSIFKKIWYTYIALESRCRLCSLIDRNPTFLC